MSLRAAPRLESKGVDLDAHATPSAAEGLIDLRLAALGDFFDRCTAAPRCGRLYPNLRASFESRLARLAKRPASIPKDGGSDRMAARNLLNVAAWGHDLR